MAEYNKEQVLEIIGNNTVNVTFTKKSTGELRTMKCTKNLDLVHRAKHPKGTKHVENQNQVRVFDLNKNEWRSFDPLTVQNIEVL